MGNTLEIMSMVFTAAENIGLFAQFLFISLMVDKGVRLQSNSFINVSLSFIIFRFPILCRSW